MTLPLSLLTFITVVCLMIFSMMTIVAVYALSRYMKAEIFEAISLICIMGSAITVAVIIDELLTLHGIEDQGFWWILLRVVVGVSPSLPMAFVSHHFIFMYKWQHKEA